MTPADQWLFIGDTVFHSRRITWTAVVYHAQHRQASAVAYLCRLAVACGLSNGGGGGVA